MNEQLIIDMLGVLLLTVIILAVGLLLVMIAILFGQARLVDKILSPSRCSMRCVFMYISVAVVISAVLLLLFPELKIMMDEAITNFTL